MKFSQNDVQIGDYVCWPAGRSGHNAAWHYFKITGKPKDGRLPAFFVEASTRHPQVGHTEMIPATRMDELGYQFCDAAFFERNNLHADLRRLAALGRVHGIGDLTLAAA